MSRREEIAELLRAGHSMRAVQDALGVSNTVVRAVRQQEGIPLHGPGPKPETVEQTFARRVQATAEGCLVWPGVDMAVKTTDGTSMSVRRWVFCKRYRRPPEGHVTVTCGVPRCVHPDHVEDRVMREQYAAIFG